MLSRGKVVLLGGETNSEINHFNPLLLLSSTYFMCEVRPREAKCLLQGHTAISGSAKTRA